MFKKYQKLLENSDCFYHKDQLTLDGSPVPMFKRRKGHIEFPDKDVHALSGHSGYQIFFGYNVYFGCADELSWFKDTEEHPIAAEVWEGLTAAATTRFIIDGIHYYKLLGISSPQDDEDFLVKSVTETETLGRPYALGFIDGDSDAGVEIKVGSWTPPEADGTGASQ